ncbi:hypothetical protein EON67_08450 [archaeon]|nr:MAG: hypothetical protein EON67_08450 [archaeon]
MQATSSYYRTMLSSDTRASRVAMAVFAQQPHDSVQRMVALGVLVDTPEYIARFLYHSKGRLSPRGVGMLLTTPSEHAESRRAVLSSFMSHFDFRGLLPSEALRKVLQYTHMPNNSRRCVGKLARPVRERARGFVPLPRTQFRFTRMSLT